MSEMTEIQHAHKHLSSFEIFSAPQMSMTQQNYLHEHDIAKRSKKLDNYIFALFNEGRGKGYGLGWWWFLQRRFICRWAQPVMDEWACLDWADNWLPSPYMLFI
jgi:hypothetical protein